jgi:hypothetical protein
MATRTRLSRGRPSRPGPALSPPRTSVQDGQTGLDRDYWLAHCEGYRVNAADGRLGFVEAVRRDGSRDGPVRAGGSADGCCSCRRLRGRSSCRARSKSGWRLRFESPAARQLEEGKARCATTRRRSWGLRSPTTASRSRASARRRPSKRRRHSACASDSSASSSAASSCRPRQTRSTSRRSSPGGVLEVHAPKLAVSKAQRSRSRRAERTAGVAGFLPPRPPK